MEQRMDNSDYEHHRTNAAEVNKSGYKSAYIMHLLFGCDMAHPEDHGLSRQEAMEIRRLFDKKMNTYTQLRGEFKIGTSMSNESIKALQRVHSLVQIMEITINYQSSDFASQKHGLEYCMEVSRVVPNLLVHAKGYSGAEHIRFINGQFLRQYKIAQHPAVPQPVITPRRRQVYTIHEALDSHQMPTDPDVKNCILEAWEESPQTIHFYEEDGVIYYDDYDFGKAYPLTLMRYSSEIGLHVGNTVSSDA
jgi:hypothetical protein